MFDLPIDAYLLIQPDNGETVERALKRIKVRASKYRAEGRAYVVAVEGGAVRVQRVEMGTSKKYSAWEGMKAGDTILWSEDPTRRISRQLPTPQHT